MRPHPTPVVAIGGGIASGKSTVAAVLRELGGVVVDADAIGHEILRERDDVKAAIRRTFGPEVFDGSGGVDRDALGRLVFSDPGRLRALNRIMHPAIVETLWRRVEEHRRAGALLVVVDAALFFDFEPPGPVDLAILTAAPPEVRLERLVSRDGSSRSEAARRIQSQPHLEAWAEKADLVIDTRAAPERVRRRVLDEIGRRFPWLAPPAAPC